MLSLNLNPRQRAQALTYVSPMKSGSRFNQTKIGATGFYFHSGGKRSAVKKHHVFLKTKIDSLLFPKQAITEGPHTFVKKPQNSSKDAQGEVTLVPLQMKLTPLYKAPTTPESALQVQYRPDVRSRNSLSTPLPLAIKLQSVLASLNGRKRKYQPHPFEKPDDIYKIKKVKKS